jgi:hypothetical protein
MKKVLLIALFLIIAGISSFFIAGLFYIPYTPSPVAESQRRIAELYLLLDLIANDTDINISNFSNNEERNDAYYVVLQYIQKYAKKSSIRLPFYITSGNNVNDPWGRPFNIKWLKELPVGSCKLYHPSSICIWSSGENGVNEYGGNDDISLKR